MNIQRIIYGGSSDDSEGNEPPNSNKLIIIIVLLFICCIIGFFVYYFLSQKKVVASTLKTPSIVPVKSNPSIVPVKSNPSIIPVKSNPSIIPVKSNPSIIPIKTDPVNNEPTDNTILYTLIDNGVGNIKYTNDINIGSNSALKSTSSEWDSIKGIFTVSSDGYYLINTSFFVNNKNVGSRILMMINNKSRYAIIEGKLINSETLRTYSTVEQLSKGDTISFKLLGTDITIFFSGEPGSHSKITITKLNNPILYTLMDDGPTNITYTNDTNIGSNSAFKSTSSEWDSNKGIFTASSDGYYLIDVSLFINLKNVGSRISLMVNNKSRYMIIQGDIINSETLRTYSTVEQLSKGDTLSFKLYGTELIVFFGSEPSSHSKITITKLDNPILYTLMDNGPTNVKYDNGVIIGSNSVFKSTSSEWDSNKGIFTASSNGNYLINASLFINNFNNGITRISMFINNKARYVISESQQSNGETLRTYSTVEKLSKGDNIYFKLTDGNNFIVFFGSDPSSHSKITITKLN